MIKLIFSDKEFCFRPLNTVHEIFVLDGQLMACLYMIDQKTTIDVEIIGFEYITSDYFRTNRGIQKEMVNPGCVDGRHYIFE